MPKNIALKLPYPKIEKTVPQFLTIDEYNRLIRNISRKAQDILELRNLHYHHAFGHTWAADIDPDRYKY